MKLWHAYFVLAWSVWIQEACSGSCYCYGPASDPIKHGCKCRQLSGGKETISYHNKFSGSEPQSTTIKHQSQLVAYPQGGTFADRETVTLFCNISYVNTVDKDPSFMVTWEHNGTKVGSPSPLERDGVSIAGAAIYFSTFIIEEFMESSQGEYMCRINNGNYSVVSPVATLQLPKFFGWIDRAYPIDSHSDIVNLTVEKGGSVILECSPNTTESLEGRIPVWQERQNKMTTLLPSGNMLVRDVQEDTNFSCVWALRQARSRTFTVRITDSPDTTTSTHDWLLVVRPEDRSVVAGSDVELYCVSRSISRILWLKDGVQVEGDMVIGDGQVLLIQKATTSAAGNYTCTTSNGHTSDSASATVTVIESPSNTSLSVSGNGIFTSDGSDVIIPTSAVNISLFLHCHVTNNEAVYYQWWSRGVLIESGYDRETLSIVSSDQWNVTGSYQCIVSNIAGQASSAAISVIIGKPSPPTNVKIQKNTATYFQYDIIWDQPERAWKYSITDYTVQTLAYYDRNRAYFCSCTTYHRDEMFAFLAGCSGNILQRHSLYYRVAANTDSTGQSDFTHGHSSITIEADAPPPADDLRVVSREINRTSHMWDISVDWTYKDEDSYSSRCYDTYVTLTCGDTVSHIKDMKPFRASVNCCTTCTWSVTNNNLFYHKNSSTTSDITTGAISPSNPPHLKSVQHNGTEFSLSFMLPKDPEVSCVCDLESVEVTVCITNTTFKDCASKSVSLNDTMLSIDLPRTHCSKSYNVSLAFHNSGGMSDFSNVLVSTPSGDVGKFSKGLTIHTDDRNVMVYYELLDGAECLLKDGYLQSQICYKYLLSKEAVCSDSLLEDSDANCSRIDTEKGYITLPRYHKYCIAAGISGLNRDSLSLVVPANESIPTGQPMNLAVKAPNSTIIAEWTAPPFEEWKGIPERFSVNISVDQRLINSTSIPVQSLNDYETTFPLNERGDNFTVAISSCTSVGCGPSAEKTIFKNIKPTSKSDMKDTVIVVVSSLAGIVILVSMILLASCIWYQKRAKNEDNRLDDMNYLISPVSNISRLEEYRSSISQGEKSDVLLKD